MYIFYILVLLIVIIWSSMGLSSIPSRWNERKLIEITLAYFKERKNRDSNISNDNVCWKEDWKRDCGIW